MGKTIEVELLKKIPGNKLIDIDFLIRQYKDIEEIYKEVKRYREYLKEHIMANLLYLGWEKYVEKQTKTRVKLIRRRKKEVNYEILRSLITKRQLNSLLKEKVEYDLELVKGLKKVR